MQSFERSMEFNREFGASGRRHSWEYLMNYLSTYEHHPPARLEVGVEDTLPKFPLGGFLATCLGSEVFYACSYAMQVIVWKDLHTYVTGAAGWKPSLQSAPLLEAPRHRHPSMPSS
ncbi:hypothetical protein CVT26_010861 [Gymnopilus dilepis]|uniref:Uncharacterized protein n=1 Tax=Gymnopilus dilepis TaxID=231916 RepID=A0A409W5C7_9AGAR|nr:hypothetical protein CVT26_010861 [Gymnopilus dilepis]